VNVCEGLNQIASGEETFLSRVITDEYCIYGYDPEAKPRSYQRRMKSKGNSMLNIFLTSRELFAKNSSWQAK
jgi:hypothetical protein